MMQHSSQPLDKDLRNALERTVKKARDIAEQAAREALEQLGVGEAKPADYLSDAQRKLRTRLRALGRQLGDVRHSNAEQDIHEMITGVAYEHWHRMLFARYLEQNNLLMYDEYTALTLDECNELVQEPDALRDEQERRCKTGWELAGVLASKMLPQIFRIDSPVFELELAPEHQRALTALVNGLAADTFQASDSLGWVYQFWQSDNKDRINQSEVKIGARELPAVTQLFTEPYMVSFLLDNALGAWWANKRLTEEDWLNAQSEDELRQKASIPGVPLSYLRFVQEEQNGVKRWTPAAGTFDQWPEHLSELKILDPCCGSGHFLVGAFLILVQMRMEFEKISAEKAVSLVLSENIFGLELDQRCVEIAAFALALEAWRYPEANGFRKLPRLNVSWCGQDIPIQNKHLEKHNETNQPKGYELREILGKFSKASLLGSLIEVSNETAQASLFELTEDKLIEFIKNKTVNTSEHDNHEELISAQGILQSAKTLAKKYNLIITNVPFRQSKDLDKNILDYIQENYPNSKTDIATVFHQRLIKLLEHKGVLAIVQPQGFLYKDYYKAYRNDVFKQLSVPLLARLGARAFQEISGEEVKVILGFFQKKQPTTTSTLTQVSVENLAYNEKSNSLITCNLTQVKQQDSLISEASILPFESSKTNATLLEEFAYFSNGIQTGDYLRFGRVFWEAAHKPDDWSYQMTTVGQTTEWGGRSNCINWEKGGLLQLVEDKLGEGKTAAWIRGTHLGSERGVAISAMGELKATLYKGELFDDNTVVIIPKNPHHLKSLWELCSSASYNTSVRKIDQSNKVRSALLRVEYTPYETNLTDLPLIYSDDPTQWFFHGHPCGSVIWDEQDQRTAHGDLRIDETVLQIAVARLLGYQWPAELGTDMELAPQQREWVQHSQSLNRFTDDDGIVCLDAVRGEAPADQRLEALLEAAYGDQWTVATRDQLLKTVGGKSLKHWLRDKFFEQHCKLFQNRPFIWHIWDGLNDGFSALFNYHKLDKAGLERLIYTYLGDWIRTQQAGLKAGTDGAQERLAAAETLKTELEAILQGEKPYDIFVRWKPLEEQPIGWNPDLNDGVRLNIRPFLYTRDLGKKDAGILRAKPNIHWKKDRGTDVPSAPWYHLGLEYNGKQGDRINEHHLTLDEKRRARSN